MTGPECQISISRTRSQVPGPRSQVVITTSITPRLFVSYQDKETHQTGLKLRIFGEKILVNCVPICTTFPLLIKSVIRLPAASQESQSSLRLRCLYSADCSPSPDNLCNEHHQLNTLLGKYSPLLAALSYSFIIYRAGVQYKIFSVVL